MAALYIGSNFSEKITAHLADFSGLPAFDVSVSMKAKYQVISRMTCWKGVAGSLKAAIPPDTGRNLRHLFFIDYSVGQGHSIFISYVLPCMNIYELELSKFNREICKSSQYSFHNFTMFLKSMHFYSSRVVLLIKI